jgi:hypothetical protein
LWSQAVVVHYVQAQVLADFVQVHRLALAHHSQ